MSEHRHKWRLSSLTLPDDPLCRKCGQCGVIEYLSAGHWLLLTRKVRNKETFPAAPNERVVVKGYSTTDAQAAGKMLL